MIFPTSRFIQITVVLILISGLGLLTYGCKSSSSSGPQDSSSVVQTDISKENPPPPMATNLIAEKYGSGSGTPPVTKDSRLVRVSFLTPVEGKNKLFSINAVGDPATLQVLVTDPTLDIIEHEWDGSGHAVFVARETVKGGAILGLFTFDSSAGTVTKLTAGLSLCTIDAGDFRFSFQIEGDAVAFLAAKPTGDDPCGRSRNFFVARTNGQNITEISNGLVEMPGPKPLSPDGKTIGFAAHDGHDIELYVVAIDTQVHTALTKNLVDEIEYPVACVDGRWAFTASDETNYEIHLFDRTAKPVVTPLTSGETNFFNIYWNPDCTTLVFQGLENAHSSSEVFTYSFRSKETKKITDNGSDEDLLANPWNPALDILHFTLQSGDTRQLGLMHLDGTPEQWTAHEATLGQAVWVPGGQKILYSTQDLAGNTQIWMRDIPQALLFPLGQPRAGGVALNFVCGDPNFAVLKDSDGHDADIWIVDLSSGSRRNLTANALDDFDPQCGLLPGDAIGQPMPVATTTSGTRNPCDRIACDPGTTCFEETGACVAASEAENDCRFTDTCNDTTEFCAVTDLAPARGVCMPKGYCDSRNECPTGSAQTCNMTTHVCEGPPPQNNRPEVEIKSVCALFGDGDVCKDLDAIEEGMMVTITFKVTDPDPNDTVTMTREDRLGTPTGCDTDTLSCLSRIPTPPPAGTPDGANWKFTWPVPYTAVPRADDSPRRVQVKFLAKDNHNEASLKDDSPGVTFTIEDRVEPPPILLFPYLEGAILSAPFSITLRAGQPVAIELYAVLDANRDGQPGDGNPLPLSSFSLTQEISFATLEHSLAPPPGDVRLTVRPPCGPAGPYDIPLVIVDPLTHSRRVETIRIDYRKNNHTPTVQILIPNPDGTLRPSSRGSVYEETLRAAADVSFHLLVTDHDPEDVMTITHTVSGENPDPTTKAPPNLAITEESLPAFPSFDAATCTFNHLRKANFTANGNGPGVIKFHFSINDGVGGHNRQARVNYALGSIRMTLPTSVAFSSGFFKDRPQSAVEGEVLLFKIWPEILGDSRLDHLEASMGELGRQNADGSYPFTWTAPEADSSKGCQLQEVSFTATRGDISIKESFLIDVASGTLSTREKTACASLHGKSSDIFDTIGP